jgi:2-hydroxy-6-oxonona-2,4-dienedioate hydrolase
VIKTMEDLPMALTEEGLYIVPGLASRYVRLASGAKAHYVTSGDTGPSVVLLHGGIPGSSGQAGFRFMAPFLGANGFRVFCPDFPGFGLTENYEDAYEPDYGGAADFLHEFVTALALDKFHISGNSMGCENAVNYVTAHPDKILSYALIAGGIGDIVSLKELMDSDPRLPEDRPDFNAFDGTEDSMRKMMLGIIRDPSKITDDLVAMRTYAAKWHLSYFAERADNWYLENQQNLSLRLSTKGRFDKMTIPGIYLYGTEDLEIPHTLVGYPQEDGLPNVQFFYPEETGHQGQTDQPELFNQVILEFLRDGKVSWDTAQRAGISDRRAPNPRLVAVPENATL